MTPQRSSEPVDAGAPGWLIRAASVGVRLLVLVVLVWVVAALAVKLTLLVVAVLVALLLAGAFAPTVEWASAKGVPRSASAAAVMLVFLIVVAAVTTAVGVRVASELPQLREQVHTAATDLSGRFGVDIPMLEGGSGKGASKSSAQRSGGSSDGLLRGSSALTAALGSAQAVADVLIGFFLTLALAFLFLKDGPAMWQWALSKVGGRAQADVDAAGRTAWHTVGAYVRGLTIVALFDSIGIGVGLLLLGIPLVLTLVVLQFIGSYIPTVGAFVAGAVAVGVAYVDAGLGTAAAVAALVLVVQQVGNDLLEPYVLERELPLNAFVVLAAVTAGGLLWGVAGALLFVPLAAAISAVAHELWVRHGSRPLAGA